MTQEDMMFFMWGYNLTTSGIFEGQVVFLQQQQQIFDLFLRLLLELLSSFVASADQQ
jgi:hypothetical protein